MTLQEQIKAFIGEKVKFDEYGSGYLWGVNKKGESQMIGEVRGWGSIQNLFKNKDGSLDEEKAENFQDEMGKFIAEAITEKLSAPSVERCYSSKEMMDVIKAAFQSGINKGMQPWKKDLPGQSETIEVLSKEYGIKI